MHTQSLKTCVLALAAVMSFASVAGAEDAPAPFNKWRIDISGVRATESGELQFRLTPHDGDAILVTAKVPDGRGELYIAQAIRDAFLKQLPKGRFGIDVIATQQVLLKPRPGEPDFIVELVDSAVPGIRIHLKRG